MLVQILNLTWKELLQLARDRFLVLFLILAPTLQLVLLANNTARGIVDLPAAVLDLDQSALSRDLVLALDNSEEMQVRFFPPDRGHLLALLDAGDAQVGIVIPPGFSRAFFAGNDPAQIQALVDGSNVIVGANARQVIESVANQLLFRRLRHTPLPDMGGVEVRTSALFNPAFDFQWFGIPSMVAFITYQVALVVAATGFVREKELGTLEQLLITPLRRLELIIGKALPAILVGLFNFLLLLAVQRLGFGVPLRGDLGLLIAVAALFVVAIVGQGTLISVFTQTQQQAVLLVFLVAILEVTISGYLLPVESMPLVMRGLAQVSALQHFMAIMRAVALRGADLAMIQGHVLAIFIFALAAGGIAWRGFTRAL
ncbi:MAG: ABC transporter permease [Caldilineales bacterium]|nr:ABC transporter permease [Caldilineales bacterium]